jgi:superfamily I DNA and/or RNA helicase
MHPTLNGIIGPNFYGQKFNNWEHLMEEQPKATPSAFIIFHVEDASELYSKKSFSNKTEAMAVKDFAMYLTKYYDDIGIISPYTQQVALLHSLFTKNKKVEIKSFD